MSEQRAKIALADIESARGTISGHVLRTPMLPAQTQWIESLRVPVLMDTAKARRELSWRPRHDAEETLQEMVSAARAQGLIGGG